MSFLGSAPTDVRRIQALWETPFGYDRDGNRVAPRDITPMGGGKFYIPGQGAVLVLTEEEVERLRMKRRAKAGEIVAAQPPFHPKLYVFKASR